jgi:hypothetical protein
MILSRASRQLPLLNVPPKFTATNNATARTAYGSSAQEIVCAALNLRPIPINGNCEVCFDAENDEHFFEIKSVRRGGKLVLYDFRMKKESATGVSLWYAILIHRLKGERANVLQAMIDCKPEILLVESRLVHHVAFASPLFHIKTQHQPRRNYPGYNGYTRAGYNEGYRNVPVNCLKSFSPHSSPETFSFYGKQYTISVWRP